MTHHALINVKPAKLPPHTLIFPEPVPGSVLCQLEVLSVHQVSLCTGWQVQGPLGLQQGSADKLPADHVWPACIWQHQTFSCCWMVV